MGHLTQHLSAQMSRRHEIAQLGAIQRSLGVVRNDAIDGRLRPITGKTVWDTVI